MTISVLRTADAWWVQTRHRRRPDRHRRDHHRRAARRPGGHRSRRPSSDTVPVDTLDLVSPVTAPCRVVAQMTNFASHVKDAGMDPETIPLTFFRKASGSISGPTTTSSDPATCRFLDYEVEIGLVIGREIPVGTAITESDARRLHRRAGRHQRRVGPRHSAAEDPVLRGQVVPDVHPGRSGAGAARRRRTRSASATCACGCGSTASCARTPCRGRHDLPAAAGAAGADPVPAPRRRRPVPHRHAGRHRAQRAAKPIEIIGSLLPPAMKWKPFFKRQAKNPKYLQARRRRRNQRRDRRRRDRPRYPAHGGEVRVTRATSSPSSSSVQDPTGITAATLLAQYGIECLVLDRWSRCIRSRARCIWTTRSSASSRVSASPRSSRRSPGPHSACDCSTTSMRVLAEFHRDTGTAACNGFPQANMFDQPELEELLRTNLKQYPCAHLRGDAEVTDIADDGQRTNPGDVRRPHRRRRHVVVAEYVLGCDGANSVVRSSNRFADMHDSRFEQRWLVVDIATDRRPRSVGRSAPGLRSDPRGDLHAHRRVPLPLGVPVVAG